MDDERRDKVLRRLLNHFPQNLLHLLALQNEQQRVREREQRNKEKRAQRERKFYHPQKEQ
jgi:hypothetical protein